MSNETPRLKSSHYDETIRRLLEEGKRLGTVKVSTDIHSKETPPTGKREFSDDVSNLKREIEKQNEKTFQLQEEIRHATDAFRASANQPAPLQHRPPFIPHKPHSMNTNNNNAVGSYDTGHRQAVRGAYSHLPSTEYLEKALEDSQSQVNYLTKKLADANASAEKQKVHFRTAVEDLQTKLQETIAGRKQLVHLREQEMEEQQEMIQRLQTTVKELAMANQMQEQSLLDGEERTRLLEKRTHTSDQMFERMRTLFASHEKIKGKTFRISSDTERLSEVSPEFLMESLERFMNEYYEEEEALKNKIMQLENDICDVGRDHEREVEMLSTKQQEVAEQLKIDCNERVLEEKLNTDSAMKQVYSLQDEIQQQKYAMSSKERELQDAEKQLTIMTDQFEDLKSHYFEDKDNLQSKLLNTESELATLKEKNETYKHECERLKQQVSDSQANFLRTNEELKTEREQRRNLWIKDGENNKDLSSIKAQLEEKSEEVVALREKVSDLRADLSTQVAEKVREAEVIERSKAERKIADLTEDVTRLREELSHAKATLQSNERQISDVMVERSDTMKVLQERDHQYERISSQCNVAERKLAEVVEAKKSLEEKFDKLQDDNTDLSLDNEKIREEWERTRRALEEKERVVDSLRRQVEETSSALQKTSSEMEDVKIERSKTKVELKEKTKELDQIRSRFTEAEKTISDYENRIGQLIQDKNRLDKVAQGAEDESSVFRRKHDELSDELKDARIQVTALIEERDNMKKQRNELESKSRSEKEKLKKQLKHTKKNLQQAENSLKAIKSVDGRAVRIAENMQKEVTDKRSVIDSLQTEMSKVYDKLSVFEKENKKLKREVATVSEKCKHSESAQHKLEEELRQKTKSEKGFKVAAERLEKGLEKAAERNAEAQKTIEKQEQEIGRLHIQHNMQLLNKRPGTKIIGLSGLPDPPQVVSGLYQQQPAPTPLQPDTNAAQTLLTRLILNMNQQPAIPDITTQMNNFSKVMMRDAVEEQKNESKAAAADAMNADLCKVLSEVRDQLVKMDRSSVAKKSSPTKMRSRRSKVEQIVEFDSESSELPVVTMTSDVASVCSLSLLQGAAMVSTPRESLLASSPCKPAYGRNGRPPSPVSELLANQIGDQLKGVAVTGHLESPLKSSPKRVLQDTDSNSMATSENMDDLPATSTAALKTAITNTAEDLCKQLQDRLEGLTKMGGKLKQQNKIAQKMINKQDQKLQKVRSGLKFR